MDNANKIIDRIKLENIKPTPKWLFSLKSFFIWSGFLLTIIFGALAFSVILLVIQQTDFSIFSHLAHSKVELFLGLLPVIWLISVFIFLGLAIVSIRSSWKGYKFSFIRLVSICVSMSITLGTLFFITGGSEWLEKSFALQVASYESIEERKQVVWSNPEQGYLSGKIIRVNEQTLILEDFNREEWEINYSTAFIAPIVLLEPTEVIKIVGSVTQTQKFNAEEIRPWGGRGHRDRGIRKK